MEQLQAQCRGQGTIALHPDGRYYCNLSRAAAAHYRAEGTVSAAAARCRAAAKAGSLATYEPARRACEDIWRKEAHLPRTKTSTTKKEASIKPKETAPVESKSTVYNPPPTTTLTTAVPVDALVSPRSEKRVALVIGNSAYKNAPYLPNPIHDAEMIAVQLRKLGFQKVTLETDLSHEHLTDALKHFAADAEQSDWALVYFAGHGLEIGGLNYMIPIDASLESDRQIQFEALPLEQLLGAVEGAKKLRLVLVDACRDNPFLQRMKRSIAARSLYKGLAPIEPDAGTLVAFAAKDHQIAFDGEGEHSPFSLAFVKYAERPGLEVRRLFDFVRDDVMENTQSHQQPYTYGSLPASQDFYFLEPTANRGPDADSR